MDLVVMRLFLLLLGHQEWTLNLFVKRKSRLTSKNIKYLLVPAWNLYIWSLLTGQNKRSEDIWRAFFNVLTFCWLITNETLKRADHFSITQKFQSIKRQTSCFVRPTVQNFLPYKTRRTSKLFTFEKLEPDNVWSFLPEKWQTVKQSKQFPINFLSNRLLIVSAL